jgi:hypothetical protein
MTGAQLAFFLMGFLVGGLTGVLGMFISQSLGNGSRFPLSLTNGTHSSIPTLSDWPSNGWTAVSQDSFAEDWTSKEDEEAYG